jgi:hypothetical protein
MPINDTDESSDRLSSESIAKHLNVSSARVKQLRKAGELAEVGTNSDGVTRLERKFDSAHESENAIVDCASNSSNHPVTYTS